MSSTVHVIRHGEVENPNKILYGRQPGWRLSTRGQEMAETLGEWSKSINLGALHVSPLQRAQETAAPQDMAEIIANRLGFTGAIGSKVVIKDGIYTGELDGKLLHGIEKAVAIQQLAKDHGYDLKECFSYSDSHNDLPLLTAVGHPSAINPDAILRIKALAEGWPIYDFRRARFLNRLLGPAVSRLAAVATLFVPRKRR